jgi:hypothetical protein
MAPISRVRAATAAARASAMPTSVTNHMVAP